MVICLEQGADLHTAQPISLPLTVSCFSKIQIGFTFLVPAHPGSPGQRAVKRVCVYLFAFSALTLLVGFTFLVPAYPCSPGQRAVKRVCVCFLSLFAVIDILYCFQVNEKTMAMADDYQRQLNDSQSHVQYLAHEAERQLRGNVELEIKYKALQREKQELEQAQLSAHGRVDRAMQQEVRQLKQDITSSEVS